MVQKVKYTLLIFTTILFISVYTGISFADIVFLENGKELKGLVVDEYVDRIILNTTDGEKQIFKKDIKDILYDMPVQNLIKLGDFHKEKGNIQMAYNYYKKAYETNPNFSKAVSRYREITSLLLKRPDKELQAKIEKQKILQEASRGIKKDDASALSAEQKLYQITGIEFETINDMPCVKSVRIGSNAYNAGVRSNDIMVAIWNRLTKYMQKDDVFDAMLDTNTGEAKITIERKIDFDKNNMLNNKFNGISSLGFLLEVTDKGLTASRIFQGSPAEEKGMMQLDVISEIDNASTRYMPIKKAINYIESKDTFSLTVRREITIWLGRG